MPSIIPSPADTFPIAMDDKVSERTGLGLVQIYTGNGKGKTTAALGLAMRASGDGLKTIMIQFLKPDGGYGEQKAAAMLQNFEIVPMGEDHMDGIPVDEASEGELTRRAMEASAKALESGEYDIVILDEINNSLRFGLVSSQEIIDMLEKRHKGTEAVLTGRGATPELIDYADLVTEMRMVKHPMDRGIPARRGIEFRRRNHTRLFIPASQSRGSMSVYNSITETIGDTPIIRLNRMCPCGSHIYVKSERCNPGGSVKDRPALSIIEDAVARGLLKEGGTIVEPTSGNMGISLAMIAAARGFHAVIVMPDSMTPERIMLMKAYGAEVVLSPGSKGMQGAVELADRIVDERGGFLCGQFDNPANAAAHRTGTGREILRDIPDIDLVYAGFGTGGTATGIAQTFLDAGSDAKVIAIEPEESPLITKGVSGPHTIQGIGANFVPGNLDLSILGGVETVKGSDAMRTAVELARTEGIFAGISSGANVFAAIREAKKHPEKKILAILPDGGEKYMSLGIYG